MATVGGLALIPSQPVRGDVGAFRNGAVVQARVLAMLEGNVARLSILGQTVDVTTPIALKPGATLPVSVDTSGGALKLLIKGEASQAPAPKAGPPPIPLSALAPLFSAAQAAITNAILSVESKFAASPQAPDQNAAQPQAGQASAATASLAYETAQPAHAQPTVLTQAQAYTLPDSETALRLSGLAAAGAPKLASVSAPDLSQAPQPAAATSQRAFAGAPQNPAQAIVIPFQLPQMAYPVEVRVERREEENGEDGNAATGARERPWRVGFSLDAGGMGPIHVSIGLRGGAISVKLAAEDAQAASDLRAWLPELKTALESSDLTVEELSAHRTAPFDEYRGRSITI
jgi:hypothetical protein